jgi:type VI protein secretion system component Hcp
MRTKNLIRFAIALAAGVLAVVPVAVAAPGDNKIGSLTIQGVTANSSGPSGSDVYSYDISVKRPGSVSSVGKGAGASKATPSNLTVLKHIDNATPALFVAVASGQSFRSAKLDLDGGTGNAYLSYCFGNVLPVLDHHYNDGSAPDTTTRETLSLLFTGLAISVRGPFDGSDLTQGFDFSRNVKSPGYCPTLANNTRAHK